METKYNYSWDQMYNAIEEIDDSELDGIDAVYGIPRGGCPLAVALAQTFKIPLYNYYDELKDTPLNILIVDDISDSGKTIQEYPEHKKVILCCKEKTPTMANLLIRPMIFDDDVWVMFPWEQKNETVEDNITRLLTYIGEDPNREGLVDTPARVIRSFKELYGGYGKDPREVLQRNFMSEGYDEMIIVKNIQYFSSCEHHMLPFFGKAHIGYIPSQGENGKVVGLSKIPRVVDIFSRRLQNQERMTIQIAEAIEEFTSCEGVAVVVEGTHFCMVSRGVQKETATMTTSSLRGVFKKNPETRAEFMRLIK